MADLTPAQELRAAATRLREFAKAAKELTHDGHCEWQPWDVIQDTKWVAWPEPRPVPVPFALDDETELADGGYEPSGEAFVAHYRYAHDQESDWHEAEFLAGPMPEPLARFIASMHPGVALAVADLLDGVAALADTLTRNDYSAAEQSAHIAPALKIARAYLGTKEN